MINKCSQNSNMFIDKKHINYYLNFNLLFKNRFY